MKPRRRYWTAVVLLAASAFACKRSKMPASIAPTADELRQVYQMRDPNMAGHQSADAVLAGAEGITVLCDADATGEGAHAWLVHLDDAGQLKWERHYPREQGWGRALARGGDGGFVIAGEVRRSELEYQAVLAHVGAGGDVVVARAFGPRGATTFHALAALKSGALVAGGEAAWKGWLLGADAALAEAWQTPVADVDAIAALAPLAGGGFAWAAAAEKSTTGFGVTRLAAVAADGAPRWQARLPSHGRGEPAALAALPDGGVVIAGHGSSDGAARAHVWVARVSPAGAVVWERDLGRPDEERRATALALTSDGGVAVAGEALRDNRRGLRLMRLGPGGEVRWERAYGGDGHDRATGLAATADGGLVLVGATQSKGPGKTNVWILRLDGEGGLRWERVLGSPAR